MVKRSFFNGWPDSLRSKVKVEAIYTVSNPILENYYQRFLHSTKSSERMESIGWHGTGSKCYDGSCKHKNCTLCNIIQTGFKKQCARDSFSHHCWGNAIYFANKSFICHSFNGASESKLNNLKHKRCVIMAKINRGYTVDRATFDNMTEGKGWHSHREFVYGQGYDTITLSRDYYVAPAEYTLVYNDFAVLPTHIVVYTYPSTGLMVRQEKGEYCDFHKEYHRGGCGCDGHCHRQCLDCDRE